ncbi:MAG TPA: 6-phosphofructokinase, partial [Geobacteraceae bacterium]|nr:6-phosphofructokinase [Geobacteraceae bacterium]
MKKIGILTSGGDCSGMNAAIRAAVRTSLGRNVCIVGVRKGYLGLLKSDFLPMDTKSVSGILQRGGTFLQSARCDAFKTAAGQRLALDNLAKEGIEGLVILGGDGSLQGALTLDRLGFPVIGIPASIDNDIPFTDMALGVDTALNNIIYAVDCIKDTASSHDRAFVIEVMGRNS